MFVTGLVLVVALVALVGLSAMPVTSPTSSAWYVLPPQGCAPCFSGTFNGSDFPTFVVPSGHNITVVLQMGEWRFYRQVRFSLTTREDPWSGGVPCPPDCSYGIVMRLSTNTTVVPGTLTANVEVARNAVPGNYSMSVWGRPTNPSILGAGFSFKLEVPG